ncbi:TfuA-like protein [Rhizobium sp. SSA_523]|uniref:TfuA-like protein n=2 Tax=Rhizobium sp. SSA_523 TaxID=2952477 RepID=UPI002090BBBD|nr:TfuA-like protein [Rhizobium sp. SSA_523]MCO5732375.1 TfuA-like protein [Rhizobium sp. SSA_523]WKC21230.1 TfuA-like protein [Rhizobium sp. SSA_523]
MKIVFVGPSLPDAAAHASPDMIIRPPARQGDVMKALSEDATAIGLIDGVFEQVAPIWHKELLFALAKGLPVLGAASMGALRAAECAAFGMIGVGRIYEEFAKGERVDDADVAVLHAPAELRYAPLTVPIVNIDATLAEALRQGLVDEALAAALGSSARQIFYKERSWKRIASHAGFDWPAMQTLLERAAIDQKRLDALQMLDVLSRMPAVQKHEPRDWRFNSTPLWRALYGGEA